MIMERETPNIGLKPQLRMQWEENLSDALPPRVEPFILAQGIVPYSPFIQIQSNVSWWSTDMHIDGIRLCLPLSISKFVTHQSM
jgi:hypothetical protein